jgi:hypothetical protein
MQANVSRPTSQNCRSFVYQTISKSGVNDQSTKKRSLAIKANKVSQYLDAHFPCFVFDMYTKLWDSRRRPENHAVIDAPIRVKFVRCENTINMCLAKWCIIISANLILILLSIVIGIWHLILLDSNNQWHLL